MSDKEETIRRARENIEKIIEKSEDDFEKQLSFIAAGALGISFTFIRPAGK